jgi:hypothetical protein
MIIKPLYVIAGTYAEYVAWKNSNQNIEKTRTTIFVYDSTPLDIYLNPDGVFIGTWKERPEMVNILLALVKATTDPDKREKLYKVRDALQEYYVSIMVE